MTEHEHEWKAVKMKLSNGSFQLRLICPICYVLDPKPRKLDDFPNAPVKDFEAYKLFYEELTRPGREAQQLRIQSEFKKRYDEYIASDSWKHTRGMVLERDNHTCAICFEYGNEVHHLTYRHFGNEYTFELVTLCNDCHIEQYHPERK